MSDQNKIRQRFICPCGFDTFHNEYYMVHDGIWKAANGAIMLCIGCLEERLNRKLTIRDFTDAPVNRLNFGTKSARLIDRLTNRKTE